MEKAGGDSGTFFGSSQGMRRKGGMIAGQCTKKAGVGGYESHQHKKKPKEKTPNTKNNKNKKTSPKNIALMDETSRLLQITSSKQEAHVGSAVAVKLLGKNHGTTEQLTKRFAGGGSKRTKVRLVKGRLGV